MSPNLLTVLEAAAILRVKPLTIRRLIARRKIPRVRDIRHIRIPAEGLKAFIDGKPTQP